MGSIAAAMRGADTRKEIGKQPAVPGPGRVEVIVDQYLIEQAFEDVKGERFQSRPEMTGAPPLHGDTICIARSSARALLSVSSYSAGGLESATTPAPACTCAVSPLATTVRMAMAVSMARPP